MASRRDDQARQEALADYINSIDYMRGQVDDPTDILGGLLADLRDYARAISGRVKRDTPVDDIELPPALTPRTSDQNLLYVDPDSGRFSPPNPLLPSRRPRQFGASFPMPAGGCISGWRQQSGPDPAKMGAAVGRITVEVLERPVASGPLRGLVSGRPMRQLPVGLPVFSRS